MKGILADANIIGPVEALVHQMQSSKWVEFWTFLGLEFKRFGDVGLSPDASDLVIWQTCQAEQLILITDNRNKNSVDSLEATIRQYNRADSLPVFTISSMSSFDTSRTYAEKVLEDILLLPEAIEHVTGNPRVEITEYVKCVAGEEGLWGAEVLPRGWVASVAAIGFADVPRLRMRWKEIHMREYEPEPQLIERDWMDDSMSRACEALVSLAKLAIRVVGRSRGLGSMSRLSVI